MPETTQVHDLGRHGLELNWTKAIVTTKWPTRIVCGQGRHLTSQEVNESDRS